MNKMFAVCSYTQYVHWTTTMSKHMSVQGAQSLMARDLMKRE
jgi:hypothetical protein